MSDEEFDEESYQAYENELYEEQSDSDEEVDSEVEGVLYSQLHYSFSLPEEAAAVENDVDETGSQSINPEDDQVCQQKNQKPQSENRPSTCKVVIISDDDDDDNDDDKSPGSVEENWDLIDKDLEEHTDTHGKRYISRYYKSDKKFQNMRCNNCNERGHPAALCPDPKKLPCCFLCGNSGHTKAFCPNELCFNCHEPGHQLRACKKPRLRYGDQCRRCFMEGHYSADCPDRWRQFHRTTKPLKYPVPHVPTKNTGPVYCYNCAEQGHYGHECSEERGDYYTSPSFQFIVKYDGHHELNDMKTDTNNKRDNKYGDKRRGSTGNNYSEKEMNRRKSWPNNSHNKHRSNVEHQPIREPAQQESTRGDYHGTKQKKGSEYTQYNNPHGYEPKSGSKRKARATPDHGSSKKTKPSKRKNKKPESFEGYHSERFVELVQDDFNEHNQSYKKGKNRNKNKYNNRNDNTRDVFVRTIDNYDALNVHVREDHHSSPGHSQGGRFSSPGYSSQDSADFSRDSFYNHQPSSSNANQHHRSSPVFTRKDRRSSPGSSYQNRRLSPGYSFQSLKSQNQRTWDGPNDNPKKPGRGFRSKRNKHSTM